MSHHKSACAPAMPLSATRASPGVARAAELVVIAEGARDGAVQRRRHAGLVQFRVTVVADGLACHPLGDLMQRPEYGSAEVPEPDLIPQRRRRAEQPCGALVPAFARGNERQGVEGEGHAKPVT